LKIGVELDTEILRVLSYHVCRLSWIKQRRRQDLSSVPGDAKVNIMNAENFREGREQIERMIGDVEKEIKVKFVMDPDKKIQKVQQLIDELEKESSGEIQIRSIHNMNMKINILKGKIKKLPVQKKPVQKRAPKK
jgi:hypothetical protein